MKKIKLILCFILIFSLAACSKGEFRTLSSFVDDYCKYSGVALSVGDFRFSIEKDTSNYYTFFSAGENDILLSIDSDEKGLITRCKVLISKIDEKGKAKNITDEEIACFLEVLKATVCSFCAYDENQTKAVINEFSLYDKSSYSKQGELTKTSPPFHFVYYSSSLVCQMVITNTHLKQIVPTEKPVSKPYFAEATSIRTETVPLK